MNVFHSDETIQDSIAMFPELSRRVFPGGGAKANLLSYRLARLLRSILRDGKYNPTVLESCLKQALGDGRLMFSPPKKRPSGVRIAVIANRTKDAKPFILLNHNGSEDCSDEMGMRSSSMGSISSLGLPCWTGYVTFQPEDPKYELPVHLA